MALARRKPDRKCISEISMRKRGIIGGGISGENDNKHQNGEDPGMICVMPAVL